METKMIGKESVARAVYTLLEDDELRFEVADKEQVTLELKSGLAEVFGSQLVIEKKYKFSNGAKVAIFTYQGCTLQITGPMSSCYTSKDSTMGYYGNCHLATEAMRIPASMNNTRGPVIMVAGPKEVGKSTLCKILLSYAVKMGRKPTFVDLDVSGQGHISVPGTIGAMPVEVPLDVVNGFNQQAPMVFHFGHRRPTENLPLFNRLLTRLADVCTEKMQSNSNARSSGMVINTMGWTSSDGTGALAHAVQAFGVDVILVIDQERLISELRKVLPSHVRIIPAPKSTGIVKGNGDQELNAEDRRVREYFYGIPSSKLHPYSYTLKWHQVKIFKISSEVYTKDDPTKLARVRIAPNLVHHLLSISYAESTTKCVIEKNIVGFYCVTNIDVQRKTITLLSPQPKPLPDHILLLSDIQFVDT